MSTASNSHAPLQGIAQTHQTDPQTVAAYVPIRQTTLSPTVSPPLPARQGYAATIQQTSDGLDPLDLIHPQPVPSTYDGVGSFIEQQTTPPPHQQPVGTHVLWPGPHILPANSHNIRQRPPIFPAPHMVYNPQPRAPELFLGLDPAHPRRPQPWTRWVQGQQPSAGHRSNSWTHPSRRRNPSHVWQQGRYETDRILNL